MISQDDILLFGQPYVTPRSPIAKDMAYTGSNDNATGSDNAFRVERGQPFLRAGKLVSATPQFKGLTIYSPTTQNQQINATIPTNTAKGSTSGPTTTSASYVVIPDMQVSVSTSGGNVLLVFSGTFISDNVGGTRGDFAFFRDGVKVSEVLDNFPSANNGIIVAFDFLDNPPAGTHTYDARWKTAGAGNTLTAYLTFRSLQALELQIGSSPGAAITIPTKV